MLVYHFAQKRRRCIDTCCPPVQFHAPLNTKSLSLWREARALITTTPLEQFLPNAKQGLLTVPQGQPSAAFPARARGTTPTTFAAITGDDFLDRSHLRLLRPCIPTCVPCRSTTTSWADVIALLALLGGGCLVGGGSVLRAGKGSLLLAILGGRGGSEVLPLAPAVEIDEGLHAAPFHHFAGEPIEVDGLDGRSADVD